MVVGYGEKSEKGIYCFYNPKTKRVSLWGYFKWNEFKGVNAAKNPCIWIQSGHWLKNTNREKYARDKDKD